MDWIVSKKTSCSDVQILANTERVNGYLSTQPFSSGWTPIIDDDSCG